MKKLLKILKISSIFVILTSSIVAVNASTLSKGAQGNDILNLQNALKKLGYFTYNTATGYYGDVTTEAVKKYQLNKGIEVTGSLTNEMLSQIINEAGINTANIKGSVDWFSQVQNIFYRGCDAVVTDIDTGKSFKMRRTFGTNHADVEPLTVEDTNIIKSIWNGFSWERRAVIVKIGENYIAGSMTAFPHAGVDNMPAVQVVNNRSGGYGRGQNLDAVKNNGINGHMDIHFLNSKTHGSNVVQSSHQNMVKKAAQYIEKNY